MKKRLSLTMAMMMLLTGIFAGALAEGVMPRNSNYFSSYGASLTDEGGGTVMIMFTTTGTGLCSQLGVASYSVQRLDDDGNWEDVSGLLTGETGSNMITYSFSRYFYGVPGETYRVNVTFLSTLNGSTETKTYTSGQITVQ
ncbi:MAG: hypothetical protein IJ438_02970 [Clostridia bacterium]|nr:hypothetical protein [Clostridia bacterium]